VIKKQAPPMKRRWSGGARKKNIAADPLSTTFAALADPTRRAILARLTAGEATVTELSAPFAMSGPAVSKHLRVLERAELISRGRDAQWRPCRLEATPLKEVAEWAENYRRFWDKSYERLDKYLRHLKERERDHGHSKRNR
jgi:DNA-binding transcriptional ArsR family regulator